MLVNTEWKKRAAGELDKAIIARENGNDGMARVCARRAAGLIIGEYLQRREITSPGPSAYDHLRLLLELADAPEHARQISEHLLQRVNQDFNLPFDADLIEETRRLAEQLLDERL
jgi:hypothetical protein